MNNGGKFRETGFHITKEFESGLEEAFQDYNPGDGAVVKSSQLDDPWSDFTPVVTCSPNTPTSIVARGKYKRLGSTVYYKVKITATDGNNATGVKFTLPVTPKANNLVSNEVVPVKVGGNFSSRFAVLRDDGINNTINIGYDSYGYLGTATSGQSLEITMNSCYECISD